MRGTDIAIFPAKYVRSDVKFVSEHVTNRGGPPFGTMHLPVALCVEPPRALGQAHLIFNELPNNSPDGSELLNGAPGKHDRSDRLRGGKQGASPARYRWVTKH